MATLTAMDMMIFLSALIEGKIKERILERSISSSARKKGGRTI
ncbi:MAG: hypothetical protein QCI82_07775 [Candidatus Thermoplasmatota archaeon]|nr:hypothetical protein [Candidatus Thermoplasmatota archaeon]